MLGEISQRGRQRKHVRQSRLKTIVDLLFVYKVK